MSEVIPLDEDWCAGHRLPALQSADKTARGRVLIAGGSRRVPGALLLTGEAALRVGAGKVRLATVAAATMPLGIAFPEGGVVALPEDADGQIANEAASILATQARTHEAFILGPGMGGRSGVSALVRVALAEPREELAIVLDAAPLVACADQLESVLQAHQGRLVMTPHRGEMAELTGLDRATIERDPAGAARSAARRFGAVIVLKDRETIVAAPDGSALRHVSPSIGLGTAGSGDVLSGVIGGLLARGIAPFEAAAWGVWLHGRAGKAAGERIAPTGYLARELLIGLPPLVAAYSG